MSVDRLWITVVALGLAVAPGAARAAGVAWAAEPSFARALADARTQGRPLLVDLYATWCGPCQLMAREAWTRDDVGALVAGTYLALSIDAEAGEGPSLVARYHVTGYPTVLVIAPDGSEIDRVFGYDGDAPEARIANLTERLRDYAAGKGTVAALDADLARRPDDLALRLELGRRYAVRADAAHAEPLLDAVIRRDAKGKRGLAPQALWAEADYLDLRGLKRYRAALALFEELAARYPASGEAQRAPIAQADCYIGLGDAAHARAFLDDFLAGAVPGESSRHNAYAWLCHERHFQLDRALEVTQLGLAQNPKDDGLYDTQAEVLADLGRAADAVAAEKQAARLNPSDPYYPQQLARFERAAGAPASAASIAR